MPAWQTVLLGAIAGFTIYLGLPLGRLRDPRPSLKAFLNAASAGILLFLAFEIFHGAFEPVEHALERWHEGEEGLWRVLGLGSVFALGLALGSLAAREEGRRA